MPMRADDSDIDQIVKLYTSSKNMKDESAPRQGQSCDRSTGDSACICAKGCLSYRTFFFGGGGGDLD